MTGKIQFTFIILLLAVAFSCKKDVIPEKPCIIPVPVSMKMGQGYFFLKDGLVVVNEEGSQEALQVASYLADRLSLVTGFEVSLAGNEKTVSRNVIILNLDTTFREDTGEEGYYLISAKNKISISAASGDGLFYGVQTLFQLLPPQVYGHQPASGIEWKIPAVEIFDRPAYSWRGMHLDVSRHFFPKEFIKKYIDLIAMHKMNTFHWHLTDDNGWRIEIKEYPLLTDISAWRVDREDKPWGQRELQKPGEEATYGGFYTQEDIREIIRYAEERHVTIIPEIEMPGHTSEVFAAYPEYSCREEKLTVLPGSYWPNSDIFCAGKESTFRFLEDILTEVAALFPSEYIHIGGDEADKTLWKKCPLCQKRIKDEKLEDEDELQSYFIKRIEKIVQQQGKKLIGWDEILEGGLAPEATVMSWRGFEGGIEAAQQGHDVIMCPTSHCYFDYYQADPETEPPAIGGYTTLKKVYSFRPTPPVLSPEEADHVLGAQGNLWTEYIATPEHAEYMAVPRMTALAEVTWSPDSLLDWYGFSDRLVTQFGRFHAMKVNYSEGSFKVVGNPSMDEATGKYSLLLETEAPGTEIYYTLEESDPTLASTKYAGPVEVTSDLIFRAQAFRDGQPRGSASAIEVKYHKAIGKPFTWLAEPSFKYKGYGKNALLDGIRGSLYFNDGKWMGFEGDDLDLVIDLGEIAEIRHIEGSFLQDQRRWIFFPGKFMVLVSEDGEEYHELGWKKNEMPDDSEKPLIQSFSIDMEEGVKGRFFRIDAENRGTCPAWHPGAGRKAWIFADEIVLR